MTFGETRALILIIAITKLNLLTLVFAKLCSGFVLLWGVNEEANNLRADLYVIESNKHLKYTFIHSGRKVMKIIAKCTPLNLKIRL